MTTVFYLVMFLAFRAVPAVYECPNWQCVSQLVDQAEPHGLFKAQVLREAPRWSGSQLVTPPLAEYTFN